MSDSRLEEPRRERPQRLAQKLRDIRVHLNLSQTQMAEFFYPSEGAAYRYYLSRFENGQREPPLRILLIYARLAGVVVDVLIDDSLDLPDPLPGKSRLSVTPPRRGRRPRS